MQPGPQPPRSARSQSSERIGALQISSPGPSATGCSFSLLRVTPGPPVASGVIALGCEQRGVCSGTQAFLPVASKPTGNNACAPFCNDTLPVRLPKLGFAIINPVAIFHSVKFHLPALLLVVVLHTASAADWIWIEGEAPAETNIRPHPWYQGETRKDLLSAGSMLAHFSDQGPGKALYRFDAPAAGDYTLWVRANPTRAAYTFSANGGPAQPFDMTRDQSDNTNIAANNAPDLRFIAWSRAGSATLSSGANTLAFTFEGKVDANFHGSLDCFVLTRGEFRPMGTAKPDQIAAKLEAVARENEGWSAWNPPTDPFQDSPIDLRHLNEKTAGERGPVRVENGRFVLGSGQPVRFWAVNGPHHDLKGEELRRAARDLAKRGVNLVRVHGGIFDKATGALKKEEIAHFHEVAAAMKAEGIYTLFSIYFPLWMNPQPGLKFLEGYDGQKHPFAALMFNRDFQKVYQDWWKEILTSRPAGGGPPLLSDPSVMGLEIQNEDSFFFWTFTDANLPEPQRAILQKMFGDWAAKKHGSIGKALQAWNNTPAPGDDEKAGRLGFRPLFEIFTRRTPRDQDTAHFLMETQRAFYEEQTAFLRKLGFKGLITASNWTTANNDILGPLEKYTYTAGDFIDRHGYWGGFHQGEHAAWSIRNGHTFTHRSALRFDPPEPGKPREISHPVFDPKYNGLPSMISETTFNRPNRYRTEAPAFYAAYGALQGSDSIIHFAHDGGKWQVKPNFFMQPWTLMSPTQMGQFPATALIYRQGLVQEGTLMADVHIPLADAIALKGSPLVQSANLDELRKADVTGTSGPASGAKIDPMIHLIGRTSITISEKAGKTTVQDLAPFLDAAAQTVRSSTGELQLDYGKGLLRLTAEKAQGAIGALRETGAIDLPALTIESSLELGSILLVPLDGQPIATSKKLLLQVMTEEKATGFQTEDAGSGKLRITSIGTDPWLFRAPEGKITVKRPDAATLRIQPLDLNGYPTGEPLPGPTLTLRPNTAYYLLTP